MDEQWELYIKRNKPVALGQYIPANRSSQSTQTQETEWNGTAEGWRERAPGSDCLLGTEFQFWRMKKVLRWMVVMVVQQKEYH